MFDFSKKNKEMFPHLITSVNETPVLYRPLQENNASAAVFIASQSEATLPY